MPILISVPVWNRKKITEITLKQLKNNKRPEDELWVYNDWSTEYGNDFLEQYSDKVFKLDKSNKNVVKNESNKNGMGVQHLRWHQFREFVKQNRFKYLYMTDNDAFHDPDFINRLMELYGKWKLKNGQKLPVCLYNTIYHSQPQNKISENSDIVMRRTAPGVSMLYDFDMVKRIVTELDRFKSSNGSDPDYGWDYFPSKWLNLPFITSKQSFVEHYGASKQAMHTPEGQWDRDRAIEPTEYLKSNRDQIISYLENKSEKPSL